MAKEMFSNRIDSGLVDALRAEARGESRSVANMLEVVLRERYSTIGAVPAEMAAASPLEQSVGGANPTAVNQVDRMRAADVSATVSSVGRAHMKRDRPAVECSGRVVSAGVCVECGAEL